MKCCVLHAEPVEHAPKNFISFFGFARLDYVGNRYINSLSIATPIDGPYPSESPKSTSVRDSKSTTLIRKLQIHKRAAAFWEYN